MTEDRVPTSFHRFFWDHDASKLRWSKHRDFIINRLLSNGDTKAIRWVLEQTGAEALRDWIISGKGRDLSPRQLAWWQLILDIPAKAISRLLSDPSRLTWDHRNA
jgi:hypothetical protein